jgi:hypothetical protein
VMIFICTCSITAMIVCALEHVQWRSALDDSTADGTGGSAARAAVRARARRGAARPSEPARPGRLSGLSVLRSKSFLYRAFVWTRRALNGQKNGGFRPGQSRTSSPATATPPPSSLPPRVPPRPAMPAGIRKYASTTY